MSILSKSQLVPRDYQLAAVEAAVLAVAKKRRLCVVSPTGTGKSLMQLLLLDRLPDWWMITPSLTIIRSVLARVTSDVPMGETALLELAQQFRITTPVRLRNRMRDTGITVSGLVIDEAHHLADGTVISEILAMNPEMPYVGFTATPFRGTIQSTEQFKRFFDDFHIALTWQQARERGYCSPANFETWPLLDDDVVEIVNGEFSVKSVTSHSRSMLGDLAVRVRQKWNELAVPCMVSFPTVELAKSFAEIFGSDCAVITAETPLDERNQLIARMVKREIIISQICTLTEGVDIPELKLLVDCHPTRSPREWVQAVGRVLRPPAMGYVVCTNRNIERHGWLLQAVSPEARVVERAQKVFGGPSKNTIRRLGLEALGRLKTIPIPTASGGWAAAWTIGRSLPTGEYEKWVIVQPPNDSVAFVGKKVETSWDRQKYERAVLPDKFVGFASAKRYNATPRQLSAYQTYAARVGMDPQAVPDAALIDVMFMMLQCGYRL